MATHSQSVQSAVDTAVVPLDQVLVADVATGAHRFDAWLQSFSHGYVTLHGVKEVAEALPVLGNILAAVDVCGDIATLIEAHRKGPGKEPGTIEELLQWASLAINLIGVLPVPPGTAAARMSLRPTLGITRQVVKSGAKDLGLAIVGVIEGHFTATLMGELEPFVTKAQAHLPELLKDCGNEAEKFLNTLAQALDQLAAGHLTDPNADLQAASRRLSKVSAHAVVHDPLKTLDNMFGAVWEVSKAGVKVEANATGAVVAAVVPTAAIHQMAAELRAFIPVVKRQLARLSSQDVGTVMHLLTVLASAIQMYKQKRPPVVGAVKPHEPTQAKKQHAGDQVQPRHDEVPPRKPGVGACKACQLGQPAAGTVDSIGFALGEESISHADFELPGVLPLDWTRTYRSNFGGHETDGPLGPRWTTLFHASFELRGETLVYHDASGRSLDYPLFALGHAHYDAIEQHTVTRESETAIRLARGADLTERYERQGSRFRLTAIADRQGNAISLAYADGRLATLTSSAGAVAAVTHDAQGRVEHIELLDDAGQPIRTLARYRYDDAGDLVAATDEHGAVRSYAYAHHLLTRYTDRTGRGMNLQWDGTHLDAKAIREWADDGTFDTRLEWHERLRLTFVTDAYGQVTQHYYDVDGYPYRVVHPDRTEEWFFRDAAKNVTRRVHADGAEEHFTWDARGNLTAHTARDGRTAYFVHDDQDNLTGIQDPEGYRWERYYDSKGRVTEAIDPLGRVTQYAYNGAGMPVAITDPKGGVKSLQWGADGQLASYTDCSGKTATWQYDERGQLVAAKNAAGETTRYEYAAGQLAAVIRPDGSRESFERDAEGRLLAHTDALRRQTRYRYTPAGLIAGRADARGGELAYLWDRLGRLTGLRNENGREYRFDYDAAGRPVRETDFDGKVTQYVRDPASGRVTHQLAGDGVQAFEFDAMGRLARRRGWQTPYASQGRERLVPPAGAQVDEEAFAYDGLGRLLQAANGASRVQRVYDAVGNLQREQLAMRVGANEHHAAWRHEYNELDVRTATVRPDGHRLDWLTYGSGHVHGLLLDGQGVVDFERDDGHRETRRALGNGLKQESAYDAAGRLAHQLLQGTGGRLAERRYGYDAAGQLERIADLRRGTLSYAYDPVGRLTRAQSSLGVETFAFDPAGNLLKTTERDDHGLDAGNRQPALLDNLLKDYAGTHYAYDEQGNLRERTTHGTKTVFGWDSFNRMVSARTQEMDARYVYDALGRRIAKVTEPQLHAHPMAGSSYAQMERQRLKQAHGYGLTLYGWDGDTLAYETAWEQRTTTHYVYEPGGFTPLLQASGPMAGEDNGPPRLASVAYYHCDQIGTPQELSDGTGALAWSAHYRAWGEAKEAISEAARKAGIRNPIRFAGQYFDAETGLHYNRHRYYDPQTGRFISKDPIGLQGGLNVYQYAPNPTAWIDPLGLACKSAASTLGRLKGMGVAQIEKTLTNDGFTQTKDNGKNATWNHADGSEVRIHKYGDQSILDRNGDLKKKSGLNAHVHKENPCGDQLNDRGFASADKDETHIGISNPADYSTVRGRPNGIGQ
ncbi:RHS repeat-associated core domain-containing protein [Burkholderia pyrrocinia]|uniref:RHS repeat-associated core domain-containing protein n=1 Tax=Burkholderia pyrrocinia TaxID=60550 RepID=UPI001BCEE414|nr:RHS repeat-associated core domain-containing protein [Burkholderia pyrrocinia]QVN23348.1 RHS repeat protein [Burkholderia pyrrocinia]